MDKNTTVITAVAILLGVLSAILGFAGEAKRIQIKDVVLTEDGVCDYPATPAVGLCVAAVVLLVIAQVLLHIFGGCSCVNTAPPSPGKSWTAVRLVHIFTWIAFAASVYLLISAAVANMQRDRLSTGFLSLRFCNYVRPGFAAGGAILALISVLLGVARYHMSLRLLQAPGAGSGLPGQGIAMAQPQFSFQPPQPYPPNPAFVHEDTYARRHIP
ncbi:protein VASCULATURE COMPLEXITY AND CONNECTIVITY-like [Wolffia australiana]